MKIISRAGRRLRSLAAALAAGSWGDLARPSVPFPGGRRGHRVLTGAVCFLAVAGYVTGTADLVQHYDLGYGPAMALSLLRAGPPVLALSRPRAAWWAELAAVVATAALTRPGSAEEPWPWAVTSVLTLAVTLGVVGLRASGRAALAMWLQVLAAGAVLALLVPQPGRWYGLLPAAGILAVVAVAAEAVRGRGDVQARLARAEERGAAEEARATLLAERARIARELHDVVAHHMSVITVQADSAPYRLAGVSPAAAEEFGAIAAEARRSLAEMRRLLHVLRNEDSPDGLSTPQPGLRDLPGLVETTRRAGVEVRLAPAGEVGDLPVAVSLSAYRLVQEALSNVVRHAAGARAEVEVRRAAGALHVTVVNSAPREARRAVEPRGGGHGLAGMRERVAMLDGELSAGAVPGGGFRVAAVLPLPPSPDESPDQPPTPDPSPPSGPGVPPEPSPSVRPSGPQ
ncbi:histidine kinase [Streptomyces sp. NPDC089919]|uniref:sensor histidine kinase n=1 Tax=Streptomyces sp. NPDC089919 TaxID=3155188 RepID=UPI0034243AAC